MGKYSEEVYKDFVKYCKKKKISLIGEYTGKTKKTEFQCLRCSHKWETTPIIIQGRGSGCQPCRVRPKIGNAYKKFLKICAKKNFVLKSEYTNTRTRVELQCGHCDHTWSTVPTSITRGTNCAKCSKRLQFEVAMKKVSVVCEIANIQIIGKPEDMKSKVEAQCGECNGIFFPTPTTLRLGSGCPSCASSKGEKKIRDFLNKFDIDFIEQWIDHDCSYKGKLRYDFMFEMNGTLNVIEYQGRQHYQRVTHWHQTEEEWEATQLRDQIKKEYCEANDINFLEIPYTEFDNIEQILTDYLQL